MKTVRISDETMKRSATAGKLSLTFKEKLELAKLLDNLGVSAIEIEGIIKPKADSLRIKSIAQLVKNCALAVPVQIDGSDIDAVWESLREAKAPRLQVQVATSPSRMEYVHKMKAPALLEKIAETVAACSALTNDVEFIAEDATRTDFEYLCSAIEAAILAGATTVTICDDAGTMLPEEFVEFIHSLHDKLPQLKDVAFGISCADDLYMAESNAMAAIVEGVDEVKATSYPLNEVSLPKLAKIISQKGEAHDITCSINETILSRTISQIERICEQNDARNPLFATASDVQSGSDIVLTAHDNEETVAQSVAKLGYDLTEEDMALVYESFLRIASKKESVGARELDAIVAAAALQVPPTYKLVQYTINSGNTIKASAYVKLAIGDNVVEKMGMGDGPIDAALAAIDDIIGKSYELDDWQMQSVTEGQEAMGEAIIKLMSDGKVYSGRGISTDIVGSSIRAYINALNKVVYEESN